MVLSLKRQLIVIGLLSLALPWFAWRYIQELDESLRASRESSVVEYAEMLANLIANQDDVLQELRMRIQKQPAVFAGELPNDFSLDGYIADWEGVETSVYIFGNTPPEGSVKASLAYFHQSEQSRSALQHERALQYNRATPDDLMLMMNITGSEPQFYSPQNARFDAIVITTDRGYQYRLVSAGAGVAHVQAWVGGRWREELSSLAVWRHSETGSTLEWQLPAGDFAGLSVEFYSASWGHSVFLHPTNDVMYLAREFDVLQDVIAPLVDTSKRLSLYDHRGFRVATRAGTLEPRVSKQLADSHIALPWRFWLYSKVIGQASGNYQSLGISMPTSTERAVTATWLRKAGAPILRVQVPIIHFGDTYVGAGNLDEVVGYLVFEQPEIEFEATLLRHAGRFFIVCFAVASVLITALLLFASIHSLRIRRLARFAQSAISEDGSVDPSMLIPDKNMLMPDKKMSRAQARVDASPTKRHFPEHWSDELGTLSHSLQQLLLRLSHHQNYLKQLASKLSHELRTPLAIVQGSLDNLSQPAERDAKYLRRAREGLGRLSSTLSAMSSANQLEASLERAEFETVPIAALLNELTTAYGDAYSSHPVEASIALEDSLRVLCVPELIVQMLDKLVDNAMQFAILGTAITVTAKPYDDSAWSVTVENIGPPLPQELRDNIFDPLVSQRVGQAPLVGVGDPSSQVHLGLGLFIARLICQFHQGSISAQDEIDETHKATVQHCRVRFTAVLPLAPNKLEGPSKH